LFIGKGIEEQRRLGFLFGSYLGRRESITRGASHGVGRGCGRRCEYASGDNRKVFENK